MKEKIVFIPASEKYKPHPHQIYQIEFHLEFIRFYLHLMDQDDPYVQKVMGLTRSEKMQIGMTNPAMAKRYICLLTFNNHVSWFWYSADVLDIAEAVFKDVVNRLKFGEEVEFTDFSERKHDPIKVSWIGIKFHW